MAILRSHRASAWVLAGLCAAPLAAQTAVTPGQPRTPISLAPGEVIPPAHQDSEAPGLAFWALSPFEARRQLLIVEQLVADLRGTALSGIVVRRNAGDSDTYQGGTVDLEVWMSDRAVNPWTMSSSFAANRGANHQRVFQGTISIPDAPPSPTKPAPWAAPYTVSIPFDRPFYYTSNVLCIETVTRETGDAPWWPIDAAVERVTTGSYNAFGPSCITGAAGSPAGADDGSLTIGATASFYLRATSTTMTMPAVALFGIAPEPNGGLSLAPFGAPGCFLEIESLFGLATFVAPLPVQGQGIARVNLVIPGWQSLEGVELYNQWLMFEPRANPLGVTMSNAVKAKIGASKRTNVGWLESTDANATSGSLLPGRAPVLWIRN